MAANLKNKSCVVVGGCGFIGSNLVRRLVALGAGVTVVDSLAPWGGGRVENLGDARDDVELQTFDVADAARHADVFRDRDLVFVLMGSNGHVESMHDPHADLERNCGAHLALLETLRAHNSEAKLVVTTTRQIYGRPQRLPVDESHPIRPVDVNGIHLQAVESYYRLYHETCGLRSACLRLTNTYGPRMSLGRACRGFAPVVFRQALRGKPIQLFGDGMQCRDFNHVDDVVAALLAAAAAEMDRHETYNLGDHAPVTLRSFCDVLTTHLPVPLSCRPFPEDRRRIDVGDYAASFKKFQRATGWQPAVSLVDGIASTVDFYRRRPAEYAEDRAAPSRSSAPGTDLRTSIGSAAHSVSSGTA